MKITDARTRSLKAVIGLLLILLCATYGPKILGSFKTFNTKCMEDRNNILYFMNRLGQRNDSAVTAILTDSCRHFISKCSGREIDSLKSFVTFFSKYSGDYIHDVVTALKDSGDMDTAHFMRASTKAEMKQVCADAGINYAAVYKAMCAEAMAAQIKRDTMKTTGAPQDATALLRNNITVLNTLSDSMRHLFYNSMFVAKKNKTRSH